jgi:hypothetical protein
MFWAFKLSFVVDLATLWAIFLLIWPIFCNLLVTATSCHNAGDETKVLKVGHLVVGADVVVAGVGLGHFVTHRDGVKIFFSRVQEIFRKSTTAERSVERASFLFKICQCLKDFRKK